jgi:hypothetical protein
VTPRFVLILALTIVGSQCTNRPASPIKTEQPSPATSPTPGEPVELTNASETELHRYVGKMVTAQGKFSLRGVVAPYIQLGSATIYIRPKGSYSWGVEYDRMEGRDVRVTGRLGFQHFQPSPEQHPPDYFYVEAETAKLDLVRR